MLTKHERHRPSAQRLLSDPKFNAWFVQHGLETVGDDRSKLGNAVSKEHVQGLMKADERSNFEKFVTRLVATQLDAGQQKKVNDAFKAFDRDGDGSSSIGGLQRGLVMLGAAPDKAAQVAKELDIGNTGKVSYSE